MQTIEQPAPAVLKLLAHDLRWRLLHQLTQSDYRVAELVAQVKQPAVEGSEAERQQVFDQLACQLDVRIRLLLTVLEQERWEIVSGHKTVS